MWVPIALDTETEPITPAEPIPRLVCVSIATSAGGRLIAGHDPRLFEIVTGILAHGMVCANLSFDVLVLWRHLGPDLWPHIHAAYEAGRVVDVITDEKQIDTAHHGRSPGTSYSLAAIADRRVGIELDKSADGPRCDYARLRGVELKDYPGIHREYAIADAVATLAIWHDQQRHPPILDAADEARASLALYAQTVRGIPTDQAAVTALDNRLGADIARFEEACVAAGLAKHKAKYKRPSPIQRKEAPARAMVRKWCEARGLVPELTEGGKGEIKKPRISLSEEALAALGLPEDHPLDSYRRLGATKTQRTGWITPLREPLIRTAYGLAETSRTTSAGSDLLGGRNLQNFPREEGYRECLVPPPGEVFLVSDYKGLELIALAQVQLDLFGMSALADMLRQGRDPHTEFACDMLGTPVAAFLPHDPWHKSMRTLAKAWNFGKPGGMGSTRFIDYVWNDYGIRITPQEDREKTHRWKRLFPEMERFFAYVRRLEEDGLYTVTHRGGHVRAGMFYPDACNTHFQGLGARLAKRSLWLLFCAGMDPGSPLYGYRQLLFAHDEHVTAGPSEGAAAALAEQERLMIVAGNEVCPDVPTAVESKTITRYAKI